MAEKLFMTALSPTMEKGTITAWHKKEGDKIKNGDLICEVETDKAVMEYESDFDAVLLKIIVNEGQEAGVGDTIAFYGESGEKLPNLEIKENVAVKSETSSEATGAGDNLINSVREINVYTKNERRLKSSPLARRMAASEGVDISNVKGSGTAGRIIKRDIESLISSVSEKVVNKAENNVGDSLITVGSMRSTIADRLSRSKFTAPHYYLSVHADMTAVLSLKNERKRQDGSNISINSILIKLAAAALKRHPAVNSSWEGDKIRRYGKVDIGFAVALKEGLIAPVVKNCDTKGILEIDDDFHILAEKAVNGTLLPSEYSSAGFSISNLGNFGIEEFTAIINPPGSAILAVGAIIRQPVVVLTAADNEEIVIKPMVNLTLSCDHRVIDGAVGAAFLSDLQRMIESPLEAML